MDNSHNPALPFHLQKWMDEQKTVILQNEQMKLALQKILKIADEKRNPSVDFYMDNVAKYARFGLGQYDDLLGKK